MTAQSKQIPLLPILIRARARSQSHSDDFTHLNGIVWYSGLKWQCPQKGRQALSAKPEQHLLSIPFNPTFFEL
jgi:hypothetical protein